MDTKNIISLILSCIAFACIVFYSTNLRNVEKSNIKKSAKIVTSVITKTESAGYRGGYLRLYVEFNWGNKMMKSHFTAPKTECGVIGRELLLIVDSTNAENSHLLLTPEDFAEFKLTFPDSLSWTLECFKL